MRALVIVLVVAGVAAGGVAAYLFVPRTIGGRAEQGQGELTSGPQVGSKLPGTFEPFNINGSDAGDECCIFCKYGNSPVAIVFANRPSEQLASLATQLEQAVDQSKAEKVGACIVVMDTAESTKSELKRLAEKQKFKHVVLSVIDGKELQKFALNPEAEATVLLYSKSVIRENRPIRSGELTESVVAEVGKQAAAHFAAQ